MTNRDESSSLRREALSAGMAKPRAGGVREAPINSWSVRFPERPGVASVEASTRPPQGS